MKIAIFSDCYLDLTGGIVTNINAEKAELERRGHMVYVFSSAYPRHRAKRAELARQHIYPVPSCHLAGRGLTPIARRPTVVMRWLKKHFPELRDFDIFYVHYEAGCSIAGLKLAREYQIPSVQFMHGREDVGEELLISPGFRTLVAALLDWFHSWYLPHPVKITPDSYLATTWARAKMWEIMVNHANAADLVLAPSDYFKKSLVYYGVSQPTRALHHGLDEALVSAPSTRRVLRPGDTLEIVWHSRVSGEKRPLVLLEALKILQQRRPEAKYHLSMYGSGPKLPAARLYAKEHRLKVTFHGRTPFEKLWQQIEKSHLDVLVSYDYDTFGMTIIEAAAAGTPVLIVDPNLAEVAPTGGYILAKSPSPYGIAEALMTILDAPECIEKMSAAMLRRRASLSLARKIDQLEKLFQSMLK